MQLQITKNDIINKFSVEGDISSVTVPYLSFNNEYFLNLELSQEVNSNFKINGKYFKVITSSSQEEPKKNIESVNTSNIVLNKEVEYGTDYSDIVLEPTTTITLSDGSTATANINWNCYGYNKDIPGTYNLVGTIVLDNNTTNTNNIKINAIIIVKAKPKKNIVSVQSITKSVDYGTTFENVGLPNTVTVTLDDNTTVDLPVTWNSNAYSGTESGQQNIAGTITLNDDLTNTNNISANAVVTVGAKPKKNIKSAQSVTKSVDYGTTFNNIGLPNAVTVTLNDDSTATLPVTWNSSSYVGTESGIQYITGTLTLNDDLTNTNNVTAVAAVEVATQPVANNDWSLQFTLDTVQSEVKLDDIPGFSEKDTPSMEDFYGPDYDNQGRHLEIRYLGTQGHLTYAPDGVSVPNGCSSDEEVAAALNPDGFADYDPDARNIIFNSGSAGTKVYVLVYRSEPFNS